jgi:hypothetical protein
MAGVAEKFGKLFQISEIGDRRSEIGGLTTDSADITDWGGHLRAGFGALAETNCFWLTT